MNDKIQNWKDSSWQVHPTLNMPELDPEAVQFAVLEADPIEEYRKVLLECRDRIRAELSKEMDPRQREMLNRAQMIAIWDGLFKSITDDQVYLLVPTHSGRNESLTRATLIGSNNPAGEKWLTTKTVYRGDTPACWCVPLKVAIGTRVDVELGNENVLDPRNLYDEIIRAN